MSAFTEVASGVWQAGRPGRPDLILLHGWGGTGPSNFGAACRRLADRWHVTALDLPGHGGSPRLAHHPTIPAVADFVAERIDAHGINPAVVVGYSLGGAVAQQLWHDHPGVVRGLVLAATATRLSPTPVANLALHGWAAVSGVSGGLWGATAGVARAGLALGANRGWSTTNLSGVTAHDGPAVGLLAAEVARFTSSAWVDTIDVPVAVIVCRDDRLVPTHRQRRLAARTHAIETIELPGGHLGFLRHPDRFAAALRQATQSVHAAATTTVAS